MTKLVIGLIFFFLIGCQSGPRQVTKPIGGIHTTTSVSLSNVDAVKRSLYAQLKEWKSVDYDYGGLSKNGVDCSGFVYLTYISHFGIELPRTAAQQSNVGRPIAQRNLRPGDLVFFKIGPRTRHVGIIVEERQFIHASKSNGVMISSLDDWYWSRKYWKAKRIESTKPTATHNPQNLNLYSINAEVPRSCLSA